MVPTPLKQIIPSASSDGLAVMQEMMLWAPEKRPSCQQCLRHNFFKVGGNLSTKIPTPQQTRTVSMPQQQQQQQPYQPPSYSKPQQPQKSLFGQTENKPTALPGISNHQQAPKPANENKVSVAVASVIMAATN